MIRYSGHNNNTSSKILLTQNSCWRGFAVRDPLARICNPWQTLLCVHIPHLSSYRHTLSHISKNFAPHFQWFL